MKHQKGLGLLIKRVVEVGACPTLCGLSSSCVHVYHYVYTCDCLYTITLRATWTDSWLACADVASGGQYKCVCPQPLSLWPWTIAWGCSQLCSYIETWMQTSYNNIVVVVEHGTGYSWVVGAMSHSVWHIQLVHEEFHLLPRQQPHVEGTLGVANIVSFYSNIYLWLY